MFSRDVSYMSDNWDHAELWVSHTMHDLSSMVLHMYEVNSDTVFRFIDICPCP